MLKKVKFDLNGRIIELSAISALDYLDYVEYMSDLDKPEPIAESDTEQELTKKLNQMTRNNLLAHTRLIAFSLSHTRGDLTVDELQQELLTNWTHGDVFRALEVVQDVCGFPKPGQGEDVGDDDGDPKND